MGISARQKGCPTGEGYSVYDIDHRLASLDDLVLSTAYHEKKVSRRVQLERFLYLYIPHFVVGTGISVI